MAKKPKKNAKKASTKKTSSPKVKKVTAKTEPTSKALDITPEPIVNPVTAPTPLATTPAPTVQVSPAVTTVAEMLHKIITGSRNPLTEKEVVDFCNKHPQLVACEPTFDKDGYTILVSDYTSKLTIPKKGKYAIAK